MLQIERLEKTFPARGGAPAVRALRGVSLDVARGDFFALLGPSGCGKTTMLQSIAGLETPDCGAIRIDGAAVFDSQTGAFTPANRRMLGMVFQSYAIWPHMTVLENVAFPLLHGRRRLPREEARKRAETALERVRLSGYGGRLAPHLSGGQQQRVAIARAIVGEPRLLLLDEPLSNLDARLRDAMREELRQIVKSVGITTIFVTHDQVEAMGMADAIAVMDGGAIVQTGAPADIYFRPKTAFVAGFVGRSNAIPGRVVAVERDGALRRVATALGEIRSAAPSDVGVGEAALCIIRPQALSLQAQEGDNIFAGALTRRAFVGDVVEGVAEVAGAPLRVVFNAYDAPPEGVALRLAAAPDRVIVVPDGQAR